MAGKYHCVTIEFETERACGLVRSYADHRILSKDAPRLPIAGCSNIDGCRCTYKHWSDRRQEPRRTVDYGLAGIPYYGPERRGRRERRGRH
jgi:hypothetical protein